MVLGHTGIKYSLPIALCHMSLGVPELGGLQSVVDKPVIHGHWVSHVEHNHLKSAEEVSAQGGIKMSLSVSSTGLPSLLWIQRTEWQEIQELSVLLWLLLGRGRPVCDSQHSPGGMSAPTPR